MKLMNPGVGIIMIVDLVLIVAMYYRIEEQMQ
jgi:Na+-transporting methylmalonyl-CoA/oxaloacetate decarboxylase gamma subunit